MYYVRLLCVGPSSRSDLTGAVARPVAAPAAAPALRSHSRQPSQTGKPARTHSRQGSVSSGIGPAGALGAAEETPSESGSLRSFARSVGNHPGGSATPGSLSAAPKGWCAGRGSPRNGAARGHVSPGGPCRRRGWGGVPYHWHRWTDASVLARRLGADAASVSSVDVTTVDSSGSGGVLTAASTLPSMATAAGGVETAYGAVPLAEAVGLTFRNPAAAWTAFEGHVAAATGVVAETDQYVRRARGLPFSPARVRLRA